MRPRQERALIREEYLGGRKTVMESHIDICKWKKHLVGTRTLGSIFTGAGARDGPPLPAAANAPFFLPTLRKKCAHPLSILPPEALSRPLPVAEGAREATVERGRGWKDATDDPSGRVLISAAASGWATTLRALESCRSRK